MDRSITRLLVANRGEIACRILRAAAELGIETVAVAPADDAASLHLVNADRTVELAGRGASAYLDLDQMISVAVDNGCDAVHPGYGFLSENAAAAQACQAAGIEWLGPPAAIKALNDVLIGGSLKEPGLTTSPTMLTVTVRLYARLNAKVLEPRLK